MQKKAIVLIALIITFIVSFTVFAETYALIMGVGDYKESYIGKLPGAIVDANAVKEILVELGIVLEKNIIYVENPSCIDIEFELEELFEKGQENDRLIFYYGGHSEVGINESGKKDTYLCGVDVRKESLNRSAYNFRKKWVELSEKLRAKETIMILDTCYAGGVANERKL